MGKTLKKFLWECIKSYKWYFPFILQAPLIGALYVPLNSYSVKLIIDYTIAHETFTLHDLSIPIAIFVTLQIVSDLIWRVADLAMLKSEPFIKAKITHSAYQHMLKHSYTFFQNHQSGEISNRISVLQELYDKCFGITLYKISPRIAAFLTSVVFLAIINFTLALLMATWTIAFLVFTYYLTKKLQTLSAEYSSVRHKAFGLINDCIANIVSIMLFSSQKEELEVANQRLLITALKNQQVKKYKLLISVVHGLMYLVMLFGMFFLILHLRMEKKISIGDIALAFSITIFISESIFYFMWDIKEITTFFSELKESFKLFEVPYELKDISGAKELSVTAGKIEFKDIKFDYTPDSKILRKFNLTIHPGEKIGLVGRSGAGKTTIINLLLRYFDVQEGKILIDGQDIAHVTQRSLKKSISVIPQDTSLFHRTVAENIAYAKQDASMQEIMAAAKKAYAHGFISKFKNGYNTVVGEKGSKLSGGQRQRIAVARAFLKKSKILILDEATSALDSHTEKYIQKSLKSLMQDKNITVIAIAHRLSTLRHMDRIIVIDEKKIAEEGSHEALLKSKGNLYGKLWKLQTEFY